ncbi:hypothetical protein HELRODRAFT_189396 [Helobdella robusta]|uniref:Uncharacterized protein n=1 Tax=Helobdella robusta TaxID=6412 RepID=T1FR07_HELRO|nr:hypothetical protein HELRODRAFT_189396 [Helobdella robusta]ESN94454.1 hypothetical protein HELRODRAFT_189396 [Helobdella robusta]
MKSTTTTTMMRPTFAKMTITTMTTFNSDQQMMAHSDVDTVQVPKPTNLSAHFVKNHLIITWHLPPTNYILHTFTYHFILQYKTITHWLTLADDLKITSFNWTTVSRDITYYFKVAMVVKILSTNEIIKGNFSDVFMYYTGDPMIGNSSLFSDQILGVVVALLFVACVLLLFMCLFIKRRCKKAIKDKKHKGRMCSSHALHHHNDCTSNITESESLYKPNITRIKETPI